MRKKTTTKLVMKSSQGNRDEEVCEAIGSSDGPSSSGAPSSSKRMLLDSNVMTYPPASSSTEADDPVFEPKYCPEAVEWWCNYAGHTQNSRSDSSKAKKHLSAMGWRFTYFFKGKKRELRYWSPKERCFYSLRTACEACIKDGHKYQQNSFLAINDLGEVGKRKEMKRKKREEGFEIESAQEKKLRKTKEMQRNKREDGFEIESAQEKKLRKMKEMRRNKREDRFEIESAQEKKLRKTWPKRVYNSGARSSKRVREASIQNSSHCKPRTILSWLIDLKVVLPSSKVQYINRKDGQPMKEGQVSREGIQCDCCDQVYALSAFEAHAGSSLRRPSANIYLKDGRSLMECQQQVKNKAAELNRGKKLNQEYPNNDDLCSICHCQGELMLCDCCPSSFHMKCLGLKEIPDGDWFCPSCCCLFCSQGEFKANVSKKDFRRCYQCDHQYHLSCLKQNNVVKLHIDATGADFCSVECKKIYSNLRNLLGRPFSVGADNLTWTLIGGSIRGSNQPDPANIDTLTENYSKLNVAISIMHECFEPLIDPRTKRDKTEDIIFSKSSECSRLDYRGFYTVILEKNDELISAATVRIFGKKMAEVPLVGTRRHYRRLGMCRVLMNELEKKLAELGIERLVLPAVPNLLSTWTKSFGFSQMTKSDRFQLLSYPLVDFVDTILCQKFLQQPLHADTAPSQSIIKS